MLVLLIIFMITSPLLTKNIEVELPSVQESKNVLATTATRFIIVTLNAKGQLFLDEDKQALSTETLLTRVAALIRLSPQAQVLIRGDTRLNYGEMVKVMSLLQGIGVEKVGLLTKLIPR
jgi:biopolymer transport protein ExbD